MSDRPKFTWMADDDAALMYRVDCYKGNATDPFKREAFSDAGYRGFLAGAAYKEVQMRTEVEKLSFALLLIESQTRDSTVMGHPEIKCQTCESVNSIAARSFPEGKSE